MRADKRQRIVSSKLPPALSFNQKNLIRELRREQKGPGAREHCFKMACFP